MFYIGLDLGTSGLKGLLIDDKGKIIKIATRAYPVSYPEAGWCEQEPEDWYDSAVSAIKELSSGIEDEVVSVAVGGQMHGLVILGSDDKVIRPAILWNDGRAQKQADFLNEKVGRERLGALTANMAYAGFTAPKILWLRENEPENFDRIKKIMLPKDYVNFRLTGNFCTDCSDAGGTLLFDVENRRWSPEMCSICGIKPDLLPKVYESYEVVGKADKSVLPKAFVCAGAGDNAASAVGTGTVENGDCNISLGTSGTVFISLDKFKAVSDSALHNFANAAGGWHYLGCILSAASANKWWTEDILYGDYDGFANSAQKLLGKNSVFFLPYLMGERSPHNDAYARGAFIGMRSDTGRSEMCLSVLEGVAFALRDCIEKARAAGLNIKRATLCGGGAKSLLWKKIIANVLNVEILLPDSTESAAYGAALIALSHGGAEKIKKAKSFIKIKERILPEENLVKNYENRYSVFKNLYPALKDSFKLM